MFCDVEVGSWSHNFTNAPAFTNRANANGRRLAPPLEPASSLQVKLQETLKLTNAANMVINPTYLAQRTRSCKANTSTKHWEARIANESTAVNWNDAKRRVIHSYRDWVRSVRLFLFMGESREIRVQGSRSYSSWWSVGRRHAAAHTAKQEANADKTGT